MEQQYSDEIDLFELFDDIKDKWYWLVGTGFVCVLLALSYALLAKPVYQTEVMFKPVTETELLPLNQSRLKEVFGIAVASDKEYITPTKAFKEFRIKALSSNTLREFYNDLVEEGNEELLELVYNSEITPEQNTIKFAQRLSHVDPSAKQGDDFLQLKFELAHAELSAKVLNDFSDFLYENYKNEVKEAVNARVDAQLEQWQIKADEMRTNYFAQKNLRLMELKEAAAIADSINQQRPLYDGERVAIGSAPPLFMLGKKALSSEVEQLSKRSVGADGNEDLYIKGLPELLWKVKLLEETDINWNQVILVEQDQKAVLPMSPIKPKKLLIVAIGVVAGGVLGIFLALIAAAVERRQEQKKLKKANA